MSTWAKMTSSASRTTTAAPDIRLLGVLAIALTPSVAHAYVDPGAGSMLLQSLLAAIVAVIVFGRTIWYRVRSWFRRDDKQSSSDDPRPPAD